METVSATLLKTRLGEVLDRATLGPVAIERHGRIVAYLVPAASDAPPRRKGSRRPKGLSRGQEERILQLCASGDYRPSRWRRAGDPWMLAGIAALIASVGMLDRTRLFALAERLQPGMSSERGLQAWLRGSGVEPSRFLPMLEAMLQEREASRR